MLNFSLLMAEICWRVWGTPANFNGFRVLTAFLHRNLVVGVSQTLRRWTEGASYIRLGGHHVGHCPTFQLVNNFFQNVQMRWQAQGWHKYDTVCSPTVKLYTTCLDVAPTILTTFWPTVKFWPAVTYLLFPIQVLFSATVGYPITSSCWAPCCNVELWPVTLNTELYL